MGYGTRYGKYTCKKCGEVIFFNEPDRWYSTPEEQNRDEWNELLEHLKKCMFDFVEEAY